MTALLDSADKLATLLVGHLVLFYWRGTWTLVDYYSDWQLTIGFSLAVGFCFVPLRREKDACGRGQKSAQR